MRKVEAAETAARGDRAVGRDEAGVQLVCLALALSLVVLACRIFSVW